MQERVRRPVMDSKSVGEARTSASDVVRAVVAALEGERWAEVVPFVRPDALREYRDTEVRRLVWMEQRAPRTPEQIRAEQPWVTPEVATFYAEQERTHTAASLPAERAQWGVTSFRDLQALSPAAFFVRYLAASTPAARMRMALAVSHNPPRDVAGAVRSAEAGSRRSWVVLGEVAEGTDKAHVVYRERMAASGIEGGHAGEVRLTTLDYADGQWWMRMGPPLLDHQGWSFVWDPAAGASADSSG
jgi:hypothetical protein